MGHCDGTGCAVNSYRQTPNTSLSDPSPLFQNNVTGQAFLGGLTLSMGVFNERTAAYIINLLTGDAANLILNPKATFENTNSPVWDNALHMSTYVTAIINTYLVASQQHDPLDYNLSQIIDLNNGKFADSFIKATVQKEGPYSPHYYLSWPWLAMDMVTCIALFFAAIACFWLRCNIVAPDVFGFVSSMTRDNPHLKLPEAGTAMNGIDSMDGWIGIQFRQRNKTNWLLDWVRPDVGTLPKSPMLRNATDEDMIAKVHMMSSSIKATEDLQAFSCENGIPIITLLGTREDWKAISDKLEPLINSKFGKHPAIYGAVFRPILSRFIETFDKPNSISIRQFWSDIVTLTPKQRLCRTTDLVTGWINASHYWESAGDLVANVDQTSNAPNSASETGEQGQSDALVLDSITYPWHYRKDLPIAYSHTLVCLAGDTPGWRRSELLVGMLAKSIKQGKPDGYEQAMQQAGFQLPASVQEADHSTLKPLPAYIYHDDTANVCFIHPSTSQY
jgi:hypothetical protein